MRTHRPTRRESGGLVYACGLGAEQPVTFELRGDTVHAISSRKSVEVARRQTADGGPRGMELEADASSPCAPAKFRRWSGPKPERASVRCVPDAVGVSVKVTTASWLRSAKDRSCR
ncbi:MAG: hypothetical protein ACODAA_09350, partial [Gemmatimonadota bacterium]